MTQVDLASRLAMAPRSIIRIEAGEHTTRRTIRALAALFGEEYDRLTAMHDGRKVPEPRRDTRGIVEMEPDALRVYEILSAEAGVSIGEYFEQLAVALTQPLKMSIRASVAAGAAIADRAMAGRRLLPESSRSQPSEPLLGGAVREGGKTRHV